MVYLLTYLLNYSLTYLLTLKKLAHSQKRGYERKKARHKNLNNASFNRATTNIFRSIVSLESGASENVALT